MNFPFLQNKQARNGVDQRPHAKKLNAAAVVVRRNDATCGLLVEAEDFTATTAE